MDKKVSLSISEFLNFIDEAEKSYRYYSEELSEQDKITQDLLHSLEIDDLNYAERAKLATQLKSNRKNRRYYKTKVEELQPIMEFMAIAANKAVINHIKKLLGEVRKVEQYHDYGKYVPRSKLMNKPPKSEN